jgi:hypothetical protein
MLKLGGSFGLHTFEFAYTNNFPFREREPISSGELHEGNSHTSPQDHARASTMRDVHVLLHRSSSFSTSNSFSR